MAAAGSAPTRFQRFLLPGFAFKGVVIGGGYATGRELVEFFMASGPWGGLLGLTLAMLIWSGVCAVTFMLARVVSAYDYRSFFQALLGRFWVLFEVAYVLFLILILAVVAAAAIRRGNCRAGARMRGRRAADRPPEGRAGRFPSRAAVPPPRPTGGRC